MAEVEELQASQGTSGARASSLELAKADKEEGRRRRRAEERRRGAAAAAQGGGVAAAAF